MIAGVGIIAKHCKVHYQVVCINSHCKNPFKVDCDGGICSEFSSQFRHCTAAIDDPVHIGEPHSI